MESTAEMAAIIKYARDLLLQLRLHPFSLQKPYNLKNHEIVKEKLYLHQINNGAGSRKVETYQNHLSDYSYVPSKYDPDFDCPYQHTLPDCFSRNCSIFSSEHKCNGAYQSNKVRPLLLSEYGTPLRKNSFHSLNESQFDLPTEEFFCSSIGGSESAPWSKYCCRYMSAYWNCPSKSYNTSNATCSEEPSKSKKKTLQIIDPANGKNILDGIVKSVKSLESMKTADVSTKGGSSSHSDSGEFLTCGVETVRSEKGGSDTGHECGDPGREVTRADKRPSQQELCETNAMNSCKPSCNEDFLGAESNVVTEKTFSETVKGKSEKSLDPKCSYMMENGDSVDSLNCDELRDPVPEGRLREEQQRLAVVRGFLRFKKQQLEEGCRCLDERRLEVSHWECALLARARRLQEREGWLEKRAAHLRDVEERLLERERKWVVPPPRDGPIENGTADLTCKSDISQVTVAVAGTGSQGKNADG